MIVEVGGLFSDHIAAALVRLRYLYPHAAFDLTEGGVAVATDAGDEERIRRDVNYELYRERILSETLSLRRALVAGVMGR